MMKTHIRKKLLTATIAAMTIASISSCGGSDSSVNTSSETTKTVVGTVEASKVAGAEVCIENTNNCAISDENGNFQLTTTKLPVRLVVKVSQLPIGVVSANSTFVPVNPITLSNGNETLAPKVGALLHALAGDVDGNATVIDLSKVQVEAKISKPIVEILAENSTQPIELPVIVKKEDKEEKLNITIDPEAPTTPVAFNNTPVNYNPSAYKNLWKFQKFLAHTVGKTLVIEPDGVACKVEINVMNPQEFKLVNCSNPEYNRTLGAS